MKIKTDCHGEVEILNSAWYGIRNYGSMYGNYGNISQTLCIGIVKMRDKNGIEKQYIGLGLGNNEEEDTEIVLDAGVPFYGEI